MATFRKRGSKWQVLIRRKDAPHISKHFSTKEAAVEWSRETEVNIEKGLYANVSHSQRITLRELLAEYRGYSFTTTAEREIARDIKEKLSYICKDYETECKRFDEEPNEIEVEYELPDGQKIVLGKSRFVCTEILFKPKLIDVEHDGIHKLIFNSIMKCDADIHKELFENIILSGGSSMFQGLAERLKNEMKTSVDSAVLAELVGITESTPQEWCSEGGNLTLKLRVRRCFLSRHLLRLLRLMFVVFIKANNQFTKNGERYKEKLIKPIQLVKILLFVISMDWFLDKQPLLHLH